MRQDPEFTVVIPTFNRRESVIRAVESALADGGSDIEVFVVDDGSTDHTESSFENCSDPRVNFYRFAGRQGAPVARNKGMELARGKFIAFLDSDDTILPGRLRTQADLMDRRPDAVACVGSFLVDDGQRQRLGMSTLRGRNQVSKILRLRHGSLSSSVIMVRADAVQNIRWNPEMPSLQDLDFLIRLASAGPVLSCGRLIALKNTSTDRVYSGARIVKGRVRLIQEHDALLKNDMVAQRRNFRALLNCVKMTDEREWRDDNTTSVVNSAADFLHSHDSWSCRIRDRVALERLAARLVSFVVLSRMNPIRRSARIVHPTLERNA